MSTTIALRTPIGTCTRTLRDHAPQIADSLLERHQEREHIVRVLGPAPRRVAAPETLAERIAQRYPEPSNDDRRYSARALMLIASAIGGPVSVGAIVFALLRHVAGA